MYTKTRLTLTVVALLLLPYLLIAQHKDSGFKTKKERIPHKAAIRSAILPGWGQVYNRKAWKVPVVYSALGFTGGLLISYLNWYKKFQTGVRVGNYLMSDGSYRKDSTGYFALDRVVKLYLGNGQGLETLKSIRDDSRKNMVYSGIYFLVAWGLNVVDATVDAHLSRFDVSDDLTFGIRPSIDIASRTAGLSVVLKTNN
ncbi:DUF5683 domain-containing protein [Niabella yanshanensis]|uniref:DUF5683 domain-containing protein n=1 Tax=Niabella yanshanensis TaxID=577386 RepID=A0ABZ0W4U9_9BACT|nr:DUF5683 domain-containing protein [Niabella yanshanensis]WQD37542.1 DUF5683 domain-containing protein [Niabella yanshanensis]